MSTDNLPELGHVITKHPMPGFVGGVVSKLPDGRITVSHAGCIATTLDQALIAHRYGWQIVGVKVQDGIRPELFCYVYKPGSVDGPPTHPNCRCQ